MLDKASFLQVINNTPLVSIDLIVQSPQQNILLGWRTNRPAQHSWFVPGGRIRKDETLAKAFQRITEVELGSQHHLEQATFIGVYEHFYPDHVFIPDTLTSESTEKNTTPNVGAVTCATQITTHYVVLAYRLTLEKQLVVLDHNQHQSHCWLNQQELMLNDAVHPNTKAYFSSNPLFTTQKDTAD